MIAVLAAAALSTLKFLVAMVPVFSVGVIVALGWANKIAWITQPLTRLGHLKPECGASFLTAFLSPSAGNAMLVRHHEAGQITRKELIIAAIVNTFPGMFDYLNKWLSGLTAFLPLSPKALSIVATRLASNVGAFTVAGNLLYASKLSGREVVLSLLVGNLLASGINLRFLIPYYLGIFGPGTGWQVLAVSMGLRMAIMAALIWTLFVIWT